MSNTESSHVTGRYTIIAAIIASATAIGVVYLQKEIELHKQEKTANEVVINHKEKSQKYDNENFIKEVEMKRLSRANDSLKQELNYIKKIILEKDKSEKTSERESSFQERNDIAKEIRENKRELKNKSKSFQDNHIRIIGKWKQTYQNLGQSNDCPNCTVTIGKNNNYLILESNNSLRGHFFLDASTSNTFFGKINLKFNNYQDEISNIDSNLEWNNNVLTLSYQFQNHRYIVKYTKL